MAYSKDYKLNTIRIYKNRKNLDFKINDILKINNIARSTLYEWINKENTINSLFKNKNKRKRYSKITDECKQFILNYVNEHKQFKIKILSKRIRRKFKFSVSNQSIYNTLKENKITNKRIKQNHYPYSEDKLKEQKDNVNNRLKNENYDPISIDEFAVYLNNRNNYGWSKKGKECEIKCKPQVTKYSVAFAIARNGALGFTIKNGSFNGKSFNKFMMEKVVSKNKNNKKYFLDNAKIHHSRLLNKQIKENCIFNVPYCSKFNPIEMFFNTLKRYLNSIVICSLSSLRYHLNSFVKKIDSIELNKYFDKAFSFF